MAKYKPRKANINKEVARKSAELHRCERDLLREQEREQKKIDDAERKRAQAQLAYKRALSRELSAQRELTRKISAQPLDAEERMKKYDIFISHACEDKEEFVRPLAQALQGLGVMVWFDEFELKVGDSLRRRIDEGLALSRYGVVVLSSAFFAKNWPQYELDGLVAREMTGTKVVLPIWHRVTKDEVLSYSPPLADKVALNSSVLSVEEIARSLVEVVGSK